MFVIYLMIPFKYSTHKALPGLNLLCIYSTTYYERYALENYNSGIRVDLKSLKFDIIYALA